MASIASPSSTINMVEEVKLRHKYLNEGGVYDYKAWELEVVHVTGAKVTGYESH